MTHNNVNETFTRHFNHKIKFTYLLLLTFILNACVDREVTTLDDPPPLMADQSIASQDQQLLDESVALDQMTFVTDAELLDMEIEVEVDAELEEQDIAILDMEAIPDMTALLDFSSPLDMSVSVECGLSIDLVRYSDQSFHHQLTPTVMEGLVRDQNMQPVEGVTVLLYDSFQTAVFETISDVNGRFTIDTNTLYQFPGFKVASIGLRVDEQDCLETKDLQFTSVPNDYMMTLAY